MPTTAPAANMSAKNATNPNSVAAFGARFAALYDFTAHPP